MQALNRRVRVPLIASGGAGCVDHLVDAVRNGGADALLLASLLHDGRLSIPQIKQALREKGVETR
jgi:cyclase